MLNRKGFCKIKPRKMAYLYIKNVKDNIDVIKNFLKEYSISENCYTHSLDCQREESDILKDKYIFFNGEVFFQIEDCENYIIFDKESESLSLAFTVLNIEQFDKIFNEF